MATVYQSKVMSKAGSSSIEADHIEIMTVLDTKNIRLNSRDYTATSGDSTAVQSKPNISVGGTTGLTALELSPRFASGIAGSKLVGCMSNPDLKGAAGGNLSSDMRCYEGKAESASGSTRTIAGGVYVLHAMQAMHGTVTGGVYVIKADAGGGNVAWSGFAYLPNDSQIAKATQTIATQAGWIKVSIAGTTKYIALYGSVS